ncbi:MAG TPA: hypothetical protein VK003_10930 [Oceanobacillus sp.]|nr:hypothetical protein [Oceanobacillus sp.]
MAFLNQQEREKLQEELKGMNFNKAKGKVRRLDPKGRLAFYRNVQNTADQLYTRYELPSLGVRVTLIEQRDTLPISESEKLKAKFELVDVIVEPTAENKS